MENKRSFVDYFYQSRKTADVFVACEERVSDFWHYYESTLETYSDRFKDVLPSKNGTLDELLDKRRERGSSTFILDVGGQAGFTNASIDGQRGVTLTDLRTDERRNQDYHAKSDLIVGSILDGRTMGQIHNALEELRSNPDDGYDLILLSPEGGWNGIAPPVKFEAPRTFSQEFPPALRSLLVNRIYEFLSPDNGMMLVAFPTSEEVEQSAESLTAIAPNVSIYAADRFMRIVKSLPVELRQK